MKPLGHRNFPYLPSWLEWLSQVAPEPGVDHEPELYPSRLSADAEREDARVSVALRGETRGRALIQGSS